MSKLTGAALDRAVANAMGLKSVRDCEKWGETAPIDLKNKGIPWTQKHKQAPQLFAAMPSNILPPQRMTEDGIDPNQWAFDNGLEST